MPSKNYNFDFYECSTFNSGANAIPRTSFEILNGMLSRYRWYTYRLAVSPFWASTSDTKTSKNQQTF